MSHMPCVHMPCREMIFTYIREPSCIILAVSAANADLANSDALAMAQMVDAEGLRTIGGWAGLGNHGLRHHCTHCRRRDSNMTFPPYDLLQA